MANGVFAVFLDRDGTLNEDPGYISDPDRFNLFPGVGAALKRLIDAGFELIVISNQSGVGRGIIPIENIPKIHARLDSELAKSGAKISHYELCFHHPSESCECRKPKPTMILNAVQKRGIDLSGSYMVGDRESDVGAARAAGCGKVILVKTGDGKKSLKLLKPGEVDFVAEDLTHAVDWILDGNKS